MSECKSLKAAKLKGHAKKDCGMMIMVNWEAIKGQASSWLYLIDSRQGRTWFGRVVEMIKWALTVFECERTVTEGTDCVFFINGGGIEVHVKLVS